LISKSITRFIIRLIILTLIVSLGAIIFNYLAPPTYITPALPFIIGLFFTITLIVHYLLLKASEKKFSRFSTNFMLTTFIKLIMYLFIIVGYAFLNKKDAITFILTFFIMYLIYTIFEVVSILNYRQPDQK